MPLRNLLLTACGAFGAAFVGATSPPMASLHPASVAAHEAQCAGKDGWSDPAPPVRIFGNVYDVGTCGIVVVLIAGDRGAVVIDGATAEAAPTIAANIERLGLRLADVKLLLSSHEHADHAGGLGELRRRTGATMVATRAASPSLESGVMAADDPQHDGDRPRFPGVRVDRILRNGEVVRLGSLRLTAHATPGHAPGGTSWSWRSCEGGACHDLVYADSLTAVSTDGYRFSTHPDRVAALRASFATIAGLPCDLVITPHPSASNLYARLAGKSPLVDPHGCAALAIASAAGLDARLQKERDGARPPVGPSRRHDLRPIQPVIASTVKRSSGLRTALDAASLRSSHMRSLCGRAVTALVFLR